MRLLDTLAALVPLLEPTGKPIADVGARLAGKRVGFYFSAGWCPMCTSFEPTLLAFREEAAERDVPIELIYVPSDRSEKDALKRAMSLQCAMVPYGAADTLKKAHKVWAGAEAGKLGRDRRSGVPAIVVMNPDGEEVSFVDAEARGGQALKKWDLGSNVF